MKNNIVIENATIRFRNFSGKEGRFNHEGKRNFCVFLDKEFAEKLKADGWSVKYLKPKKDGADLQAYIQVSVRFGKIPPKIVLITSKGKSILDEEDINILDWADIENADVIIRPYDWEFGGRHGRRAYVKSLYVTIREDELEEKYMDVPDSAKDSMVQANAN